MTNAPLTLGTHTKDQYVAAMHSLHVLLGFNGFLSPRDEITTDLILEIIQEVADGKYTASRHFKTGPAPQPVLLDYPPPLVQDSKYALFTLNALTTGGEFVSVQTGGIAYEDPFWAILAAHAIMKRLNFALPNAGNNEQLWRNIGVANNSIKTGNYVPQRFFRATKRFLNSGPKFGLIEVEGNSIEALRRLGFQTFGITGTPLFFELFDAASSP